MAALKYRKVCGYCKKKFNGGKRSEYCCASHRQLSYLQRSRISEREMIKESLLLCLKESNSSLSVREYVEVCLWVWGRS